MKHRFASLTFVRMAAGTVLAAAMAMRAGGQESGVGSQKTQLQTDPRPPAPDPRLPPSGQQLVAEAARRVASEPAISAEMRYKIDAFGHELVGTGNYSQFGAGPEKLLRLDLRLQVGEKPATVQEIRGEETYWVRRDVPPLPPTLGRVDLKQLRKSLARSSGRAASDVLPQGEWIMLGGLARLMTALEQNFAFAAPRTDELEFNSADGKSVVKLPIWVVQGDWKPEKLAALVGKEPGKVGAIPEQLPDQVELVLGRTEEVLPLFPYRITYRRTAAADKKAKSPASGASRELLTLELFNVSRKQIDVREFQYQPGDQEVQELTQYYVQRYSGDTKLR